MNGASWTITCAIAPAPTPSRNATRLPLKAEAPIQAPTMAGPPASSPRPASVQQRGAVLRDRGDDGEPLGRVVDREPDHEQGAERECARRVGGADREALAEVVEADPDGDEQREMEAARRLAPDAACPRERMVDVDRGQRQVADDRSEVDEQPDPPKACEPWPAISIPSSRASTIRNTSRPIVNAISTRMTRRASSAAGAAARACPSSTGITPT